MTIRQITNGKTKGPAPKAIAAAVAPALPGLVVFIVGLVTGDDTLTTVGLSLLGGGGLAGGAAAKAKTGTVQQ